MASSLPSKDLLEQTHQFPGAFVFKVFGEPTQHLFEDLMRVLEEALPDAPPPKHSARPSSSGKYVCITLEVEVESADEVLTLYQHFGQLERISMLL